MKNVLKLIVPALLAVALVYGLIWKWGFCRFYVQPNEMAVIIAKSGKPMPAGQILAEKGQKGVLSEVLGEGRLFRNPVLFEHKIITNHTSSIIQLTHLWFICTRSTVLSIKS